MGGCVESWVLCSPWLSLVLADSAVVTLACRTSSGEPGRHRRPGGLGADRLQPRAGARAVPTAVVFGRSQPGSSAPSGSRCSPLPRRGARWLPSIEALIAARCVQALGGALALIGCLEILVAVHGERRGVAAWVTAGVVGTAVGPFAGGLLTQAFSWQAIFVVQVPVAVLAVPAALAVGSVPVPAPDRHRLAVRPSSPSRCCRRHSRPRSSCSSCSWSRAGAGPRGRGAGGVGGAARGSRGPSARPPPCDLRPRSRSRRVLPHRRRAGRPGDPAVGRPRLDDRPQALVGPRARADHRPAHLPGDGAAATADPARGWTISARHLGVVVGLAILTPVFTADLQDAQVPAQEAIASLVLDAPLLPEDKIAVARRSAASWCSNKAACPTCPTRS